MTEYSGNNTTLFMTSKIHTLTSISPTLAVDRIIGLPTIEGKMCDGKFDPAYPHLTNWKYKKKHVQLHHCDKTNVERF